MDHCLRCKESWYNLKVLKGICHRCRQKDNSQPIHLYSRANHMDPGNMPSTLPTLTTIEQLLIAPIHISMQIIYVKGA